MDKRKEATLRVKRAVSDALFALMEERPIAKITGAELIRKAGVARISFYRNFASIEGVLTGLVRDVLEDFRATADYDLTQFLSSKHIHRVLEYFYRYRFHILSLHRSGYGAMLLNELNRFRELVAADTTAGAEARYRSCLCTGAVYNTAVVWLSEETPRPIDAVVQVVLQAFGTTA